MSAPVLRVRFVNQNLVYVSGYTARDLIETITGRPPMWSTIGSAWTCTPWTARDLIAEAERRCWVVETTEGDPLEAVLSGKRAERATERGELW